MKCKICKNEIAVNEAKIYGERCEDCWCYEPDCISAAQCYNSFPVGKTIEITFGSNFHFGNIK